MKNKITPYGLRITVTRAAIEEDRKFMDQLRRKLDSRAQRRKAAR